MVIYKTNRSNKKKKFLSLDKGSVIDRKLLSHFTFTSNNKHCVCVSVLEIHHL